VYRLLGKEDPLPLWGGGILYKAIMFLVATAQNVLAIKSILGSLEYNRN